MQSNSLFPTILEPTRVATISRNGDSIVTESLIDNFFVNESLSYESGLVYSDISDHYPIFISFPLKSVKANVNIFESKYRLIDDFIIRKLKTAILNNTFIQSIPNTKSHFSTYNQLYSKYFPIVTNKN